MPPNEPAPTAPFTEKDRARLQEWHDQARFRTGYDPDEVPEWEARCDSLTRALAHIDRLEAALEEADEIASLIELLKDLTVKYRVARSD